jgi:protein-L-isoaspartate(D-aspartate) O-methyltransferase
LVTAAPPEIPEALLRQLAPQGIIVLPLGGEKRTQRLVKLTMTPQGYTTEDVASVRFVPLVEGLPPDSDDGS